MILLSLYQLIAAFQVWYAVGENLITPEYIKKMCDRFQIEPNLLDTIPTNIIEVKFSDKVIVEFGNAIDERECQEEPKVSWPIEANQTYYTLIMTDPDNPTRADATKREFLHWLIGNIPGTIKEHGDELVPWYPPHPIKACGFHRYTFIVFKQPGAEKLSFDEPKLNYSEYGRAHFNTRKFAKKYNLGDPEALNFFLAESHLG
nr:PREDICTED: protein D2-like isoform X1 [Bemisia tabaci]